MTAYYPGPFNTFLISHEATNNLIIAYSRNPKDFAFAEYTQIIPVKKTTGAFLKITAEEAARVLSTDLKEYRWADGEEAPMHAEGLEFHDWDTYRAQRYSYGFSLGDLTVEQASWDIMGVHASIKAQQAMTARTVAAHVILADDSNYLSGQTDTATVFGGGKWDVSQVTDLFILNSVTKASQLILKATLGMVKPKDLVMVLNPEGARQTANSQEVHNYIKESPFALAQLRGDVPSQNGKYGLPDFLYGYRVVVEDAVKVTTQKGAASTTKTYVMADDDCFIMARVGGIEGKWGSPSFSAVSCFMLEEMTVETKRDDDNRRVKGRVIENYAMKMTAPAAIVRIKSILT